MAGARGLWRATGMKDGDFGKPIIAIANSFTQFVPGHVHLKDLGQLVAREVEAAGGVAKEFDTIAVDDGIAMGHDGMLYSLPSRELIADSVEYMANAHCADALVCISNCDKITPGMLMAAMRLNIPAVFVSGGPMEAGKVKLSTGARSVDLVDAMVAAADDKVSDADVAVLERSACPTCGSCSGMFTANSMNCLTEALGLSLPGNGTVVATHADRRRLFVEAGHLIVDLARRWYEEGDEGALPRGIATFKAFENAMTLDIAMGGSTNTVLHLLAAAHEAGIDFTMADIDRLSRRVPCLCKIAPSVADVHVEDVHRAGGVMGILGELDRAGLLNRDVAMVHAESLEHALSRNDIMRAGGNATREFFLAGPGRGAHPGRLQPVGALPLARRGSRQGRDPRRRARLLQGRRPRGALRQYRDRRFDREDGRSGRRQPQVQGTGAHLRKPGRRGAGNSGRQGRRGRCRRHPLRGAARRPGHAGNALSDQLSQIAGLRQGLRPRHRRALLGGHLGPLDRPRLAGGGGGRGDRTDRRGRRDRDRHSRPLDQPARRRGDAEPPPGGDGAQGRQRLETGQAAQAGGVDGFARLRGVRDQRGARSGAGSPVSGLMVKALSARSIASRLFLSAAFWSTLILALAGLGLSALNKQWTEANFDDQLGVYLKALVANIAPPNDEGKASAPAAIAPQFELAFSGWYWQITRTDVNPPEIRASKSLFATQLPQLPAVGDDPGAILSGYAVGPGGHQVRMIQRQIDAGDDGRFLVQVAAPGDAIQGQERSFEWGLATTFLALAAALIGSTALAVRFGLRPLRVLREGVAAIRRGEAERIAGEFPQDVAPLALEVNQLIDANREIVERARTQVGNLAHALKTPLSVLMNEADSESPSLSEKVREQTEIMRRQVTFYLDRARAAARARTFGAATEVKPVVDGLVRTFEKLHGDRALTFDVELQPGLKFRGEAQDLTDLIGNLLDNAGKWARERVSIHAARATAEGRDAGRFLIAEINDDGPGLDKSARAAALERGKRLDESRPGSGLGLSIVVELASIYGGSLQLDESPLGGLRAILSLPCV